MDRRRFIQASAGAAAFLAARRRALGALVTPAQVPLPGNKIPQFVDPLPLLSIAGGPMTTIMAGVAEIELHMREFLANVLPTGYVPPAGWLVVGGVPIIGTYVWGYIAGSNPPVGPQGTYIGPVIVARRGVPTQIRFVNNLGTGSGTQVKAWKAGLDQTLMWADPQGAEANLCAYAVAPNTPPSAQCAALYNGPIPAVPHLHGGEVPPELDGGPDAWFTSDGSVIGHAYHSKDNLLAKNYAIYRYPNTQEASLTWFHDHALGITRLNVYAGLAGAYPLFDPGMPLPTGLDPVGLVQNGGVSYTIPLVIQDRMFDVNGQLYFPNLGLNPEHPFWVPEFVGDTILVNGKVWPFLAVDKKRYRFLFLNGSNARAYDMSLIERVSGVRGPRMWVIGTDGGYLDTPVPIDPNSTNKAVAKSLVMMPGERYDVIIDFNDPVWNALLAAAGLTGQPLNLVLQNTAKTPFPGGAPAPQSTTGRIVQFRVSATAPVDSSYNPASLIPLRPTGPPDKRVVRLVNPTLGTNAVPYQKRRQLTLNEVMGPGGPLEVVVNNTKYRGTNRVDFTPVGTGNVATYYSELPNEGETELWEIVNLTADAHPIHLHLVQFQLMNRQPFDVKAYNAAYLAAYAAAGVAPDAAGPPNNYNTANTDGAMGGNPAVTPFLVKNSVPAPPLPYEAGWKDTVVMYPGQVTRIMVRWAPTDLPASAPPAAASFPFSPNGHGYVWHCHIIDHEDNEMMRPTQVQPKFVARTYVKGVDY